jgi:hypothetical protein
MILSARAEILRDSFRERSPWLPTVQVKEIRCYVE